VSLAYPKSRMYWHSQAEDHDSESHPDHRDRRDGSRKPTAMPWASYKSLRPNQSTSDWNTVSDIRPKDGQGKDGTVCVSHGHIMLRDKHT